MLRRLPLFLTLSLAAVVFSWMATAESSTAYVKLADGFDFPVGKVAPTMPATGEGYYVARGYRPNGHLGEDWNGNGGGNTDLGDPVYSSANGIVVFSKDVRLGWGNVVIVRHNYRDTDGAIKAVDSLYGHLERIVVREGQQIKRGDQIGTIGTNRGMYDAHLHFEMRKNLNVGIDRMQFPRDNSVYWSPTPFINAHRSLQAGGGYPVAVNTFNANPNRVLYAPSDDSQLSSGEARAMRAGYHRSVPGKRSKGQWRVSRF